MIKRLTSPQRMLRIDQEEIEKQRSGLRRGPVVLCDVRLDRWVTVMGRCAGWST